MSDMSDMICRRTMKVCSTQGMCLPHGGCAPVETKHTTIARDELKRLQADAAESATLREQLAQIAEACAKICDERAEYYKGDDDGGFRRSTACKACADVIRHRMPSVPEGFVLVPVDPAPEVLAEIVREADKQESYWTYKPERFYQVMIKAAQGDSHE